MRIYSAASEDAWRAREFLKDWGGEGYLSETQRQRMQQETVCELRTHSHKAFVAKKTHFDPYRSVDRLCQVMFNSINRGWLNARSLEIRTKNSRA